MPLCHPFLCLALGLLTLCGGPAMAELRHFGFAAVACGVDDPHDGSDKTDYGDELRGFTNLNHVCPAEDVAGSARRLARAARDYVPLFHVEPFLFEQTATRLRPLPDPGPHLDLLAQIILAAGVAPERLIFYLADEPALRGLTPEELEAGAAALKARFPRTSIMVIEAWHEDGPPPIPAAVDFWGFDAYALPDPGAEPLYTGYLEAAARKLRPGQELVLVMDAHFTPAHAAAGLVPQDMARIAQATHALALARGDVAAILGYAWPGGIDGPWERGARDLPEPVRAAYRRIGAAILEGP